MHPHGTPRSGGDFLTSACPGQLRKASAVLWVTLFLRPSCRRGFYDPNSKPIPLTPRTVDGIQLQGGTILGTSRGGANIK